MVTTTWSVYGANDETNAILYKLAGYKTPVAVIKEYFWLVDSDMQNTKKLEKMWVKWMPRLWELWVTKEAFNLIFNEVLYDIEWWAQEDNSDVSDGAEGKSKLSDTGSKPKR